MTQKISDIIIIGSGPSGAMAAQTLVEAGKNVLMLDVGEKDEKYCHLIPNDNYLNIRQEDKNQNRYLLGDEFESIPWSEIKVGAQLSPSRKSMIKNVAELTPLISDSFLPMESLGYGGLGAGWGLGTYKYSDAELKKAGLSPDEMQDAYQKVADRIGISCGEDDVTPYILGGLKNIQTSLNTDNSISKVLERYGKKRYKLNKANIYLGKASMAFLSENKEDRKACTYKDTDFYTDFEKSAWRAQFTIDSLKKYENFKYQNNRLALEFRENENGIELRCLDIENKCDAIYNAKYLIIAAGALGSGRIVLRSQKDISHLPLLCNPYIYMPCIQASMFGNPLSDKKTSMAQAMMIYDRNAGHDDIVSVALYTYRSLMLYKLIKEAPLNFADARFLFQHLQSSFVIAGIHHPDEYSELKKMKLIADENSPTKDILKVEYALSDYEKTKIKLGEKQIRKALRSIGVFPIKRIDPGYGGSIHYAGTVPFSNEPMPGRTDFSGRIHFTKNVYIADGSSFNYLPAKGITFSLMANAHRVATNILLNND